MKNGRPQGPARTSQVGADDDTALPPSFHELLAEHERHTLWRYSVRDIGELTMVSLEPITRAEAEKSIRMHFGDRLISLRPGGQS